MGLLEKISTQEKVDLVNNLSLLIKSGKPINESFDLLARQARNPVLNKTLINAKEKLERGSSLHQVFEESPHFGKVFSSFIRAGEESGTLEENLEFLGNWLERNNQLKKEISSATLYPKIIIGFAVILGGALALFVLPQLVPIFGTLDVELPITTRALLFTSEAMQDHGLFIIAGLVALIAGFYGLLRIDSVRRLFDILKLKFPVFGSISKDYQLTIIAQLITTLFRSGLTINSSLDIIAESVTNSKYKESLDEIKARVAKGTSFSETMANYPDLFPEVFVSVVATGEQTGSYGESFSYLAEFFAGRVTEKTKKLPNILEPALLIAIGMFVAFIASAIILPIYEVTQGLY